MNLLELSNVNLLESSNVNLLEPSNMNLLLWTLDDRFTVLVDQQKEPGPSLLH